MVGHLGRLVAAVILNGCQVHAGFRLGRDGIEADFMGAQIPDACGLVVHFQPFIESVGAQGRSVLRFQDELAKGPAVPGQLQIALCPGACRQDPVSAFAALGVVEQDCVLPGVRIII